jgi:lysophospholipase L1-like esterase
MHTATRSLLLTLLLTLPAAARADFPLKDGDVWVMAGDSITAQKLHSNYFEAFCYARYPKLHFAFRNSGVGGDTIPKVLARFDYDVAAWKPTVVSVELGMNDKGGYTTEQFLKNMTELSGKIKGIKARPVFLSSSPVNNGLGLGQLGPTDRLHEYALALKPFAAREDAPYADQFHALVDVWAGNTSVLNLMNMAKTAVKNDHLAGVEHLRAFVEAQTKSGKSPISMQGDAVHPGAPGQLMMAAALLKQLGARADVSTAVVDFTGKAGVSEGCELTNVKSADGKLSFDRLDSCLPFPIPDEARAVLALDPTILALSQYQLKVTNLPSGKYQIKVSADAKGNMDVIGTATAEELGKGVNLTAFAKGPIAAQGKEILAAVSAKEGLVQAWRGQSKAANGDASKLAEATAKVEAADAKIREAAKPRKLHFEISAAS